MRACRYLAVWPRRYWRKGTLGGLAGAALVAPVVIVALVV